MPSAETFEGCDGKGHQLSYLRTRKIEVTDTFATTE